MGKLGGKTVVVIDDADHELDQAEEWLKGSGCNLIKIKAENAVEAETQLLKLLPSIPKDAAFLVDSLDADNMRAIYGGTTLIGWLQSQQYKNVAQFSTNEQYLSPQLKHINKLDGEAFIADL